MDAGIAFFLDADQHIEWWPVASAALAAILAGVVLAYFNRRAGHTDKLEEAATAEIKAGLDNVHHRLDSEAQLRRDKDDALGDDIQDTRGALDHLCGTLGKDRPAYRSKK